MRSMSLTKGQAFSLFPEDVHKHVTQGWGNYWCRRYLLVVISLMAGCIIPTHSSHLSRRPWCEVAHQHASRGRTLCTVLPHPPAVSHRCEATGLQTAVSSQQGGALPTSACHWGSLKSYLIRTPGSPLISQNGRMPDPVWDAPKNSMWF